MTARQYLFVKVALAVGDELSEEGLAAGRELKTASLEMILDKLPHFFGPAYAQPELHTCAPVLYLARSTTT